MKLEDLARQSADQVRMAAESMPVIPIDRVRRNHRVAVLIPAGAVAVAGFAFVAITTLTGEPTTTLPVATDPTTPVPTTEPSPVDPAIVLEQYPQPTTSYDVALPDWMSLPTFGGNTTHAAPYGSDPGQVAPVDGPAQYPPRAVAWLGDGRVVAVDPANQKVVVIGPADTGSADFWDAGDLTPVSGAGTTDRVFIDAIDQAGLHHMVVLDSNGAELNRFELGRTSPDGPATTDVWASADHVYWVLGDAEGALTWSPVADLSGAAVSYAGGASVGRPDGLGGFVWQGFNSLVRAYPDGTTIEWRLPEIFMVEGFHSYEDGIVALLASLPAGETQTRLLVSMQAEGTIRSAGYDPMAQVIGSFHTAFVAGNLWSSFPSEATMIVQQVPLDGVRPLSLLGPVDIGDAEFLTMTQFGDLTDDTGNRLGLNGDFAGSWRRMAWDGDRGVVYIDGSGALRHATPESDEVIGYVADPWVAEILAVAAGEPTRVAVSTGAGAWWVNLTTGEFIEATGEPVGTDSPVTAQGVTATIDDSAMRAAPRGEAGEPLGDFELPSIVFTDSTTGEVLSRLYVGTKDRPFLVIHDFDGRRLIVSRIPNEPANPPMTAFFVDLECPDCTRRIETGGPQSFSLVGVSLREGPYAWAELGLPE